MANIVYPAKAVANYLLDLAERDGRTINPMQIQKLVFYAHGWHLAIYEGPLIIEQVEAWKYGPVVPELYHEFKEWGAGSIRKRATDLRLVVNPSTNRRTILKVLTPSIDDCQDETRNREVKGLLQRVWEVYGNLSALQLSQMTHEHNGPWYLTIKESADRTGSDIPDDRIKQYFIKKASENVGRA